MAAKGILQYITMTRDVDVVPLKVLCPGTLLRNPGLDIGKNYKTKNKLSSF